MGCGSSKSVDGAAVGYRAAPTSFAVFDINAIEEPWLKQLNSKREPSLPAPILDKLNMVDATDAEAPQSWDQVRKTLQDLKPVIIPSPSPQPEAQRTKSFHTVEELDSKSEVEAQAQAQPQPQPRRGNKLKENMFIVRDRLERQKESNKDWGAEAEKCPPGGSDRVVVYTTSLGGVRKTFDQCNQARDILERHRVVVDERDVSLHGEFLRELKELLGEEVVPLPRIFVKGRYLGGFQELLHLNDTARLPSIFNAFRVQRHTGIPTQPCGTCGGARFLPCFHCSGSRKLPHSHTCPNCNENGLLHCPACI
ncbi:hypothetical protein VNO78_10265 [Psophocarpus tetragonolobus]|uniref:Glutaredoxin domain-containing protein n=1 Tax=Psophocarpus tetragonolobus TaxID=3891 RepID=A0AAN9SLQ6_PSOTE